MERAKAQTVHHPAFAGRSQVNPADLMSALREKASLGAKLFACRRALKLEISNEFLLLSQSGLQRIGRGAYVKMAYNTADLNSF